MLHLVFNQEICLSNKGELQATPTGDNKLKKVKSENFKRKTNDRAGIIYIKKRQERVKKVKQMKFVSRLQK